jgi:hypothetical protein
MIDFDNILKIDGLSIEEVPSITKWGYEDLDDNPENHRWRAWWCSTSEGHTYGIDLRAYPIYSRTDTGIWYPRNPYRRPIKDGYKWEYGEDDLHFCTNGSGQSWVKPTQEEAIESLAIRLTRWANYVQRSVIRVHSAASALATLRPEHKYLADVAKQRIETISNPKGTRHA